MVNQYFRRTGGGKTGISQRWENNINGAQNPPNEKYKVKEKERRAFNKTALPKKQEWQITVLQYSCFKRALGQQKRL